MAEPTIVLRPVTRALTVKAVTILVFFLVCLGTIPWLLRAVQPVFATVWISLSVLLLLAVIGLMVRWDLTVYELTETEVGERVFGRTTTLPLAEVAKIVVYYPNLYLAGKVGVESVVFTARDGTRLEISGSHLRDADVPLMLDRVRRASGFTGLIED